MSMNLVIGGSGLVGGHIVAAMREQGLEARGTFLTSSDAGEGLQLDVCNVATVEALVAATRPGAVILAAAAANVDACELDPEASYRINVEGTANVVAAARRTGAAVILLSTDYVFDGTSGPYRECAPVRPVCVYGLHKVFAELNVAARAPQPLIVRTTVVYGPEQRRKNFAARLRHELNAGRRLRVPMDQVGTPTYAPDLARAVVACLENRVTGAVHIVGGERMSRYEFAVRAAQGFGLNPSLIEAVPTAALKQSAPRPLSAGMVLSDAVVALGVRMRTVEEAIADMARGPV